jgi:hypothetical protein
MINIKKGEDGEHDGQIKKKRKIMKRKETW